MREHMNNQSKFDISWENISPSSTRDELDTLLDAAVASLEVLNREAEGQYLFDTYAERDLR